jgi:hypothetical protein
VAERAAAAGAVAVALGGVGHFSGLFDDIFRTGGRVVDDVPTVAPPRPRDSSPPSGTGGELGATDDLVRQGDEDDVSRDVICFAYDNFYDASTGEVALPETEEFVESVAGRLATEGSQADYRFKARSLHRTLSDPEADLASVAQELACL